VQAPAADHARELDHGGGARQLGLGAAPERVAVRDDDEAGPGLADLAGDDRRQLALPVGGLGPEARRADLVGAHRPEDLGQPARERRVAAVARAALREGLRPGVEVRVGAHGREGVRLERRADRARPIAERERGHDEREQDRDESCAVDPRVEHANFGG
jgi:hypothetical protein